MQSKGLKNLLQHHSSKASILQHSAFCIVQLSHLCMTTGKTRALTRWTFVGKVMTLLFNMLSRLVALGWCPLNVGKVMSLLFNMLSRLVVTFLPRGKGLLISRLHSPSAVFWNPQKIRSLTVSIVSPFICHEVMGPDAMILVF